VAVVGDDFPQDDIAYFNSLGINTEGLEVRAGEKSFFWHGRYHLDMNTRDTLATELNVLADFQPKVPARFQNADFVMLGNLTPSVQQSVIAQMASRPKLIAMDTMNFWMDIAMDDLKATLKQIDVLTINDEEARQLSGERSLRRAARVIFEMGPKYLVIKKGEHGALLFGQGENEMFYCPALPLEEVQDPTGAGDTFAGGFMGYLAKSNEVTWNAMKTAVVHGSALASVCVEQFGSEALRELTPARVEARLDQFKQLTHF
jgi:sugar/nucleoside kinase (ribokinase family)